MRKTAEYIVDYYIKKQIIDSDMKTIYVHGMSLIMNDILNFSMILIISALLDSLLNGIIFTSVFYFLRVRCGGFHEIQNIGDNDHLIMLIDSHSANSVIHTWCYL